MNNPHGKSLLHGRKAPGRHGRAGPSPTRRRADRVCSRWFALVHLCSPLFTNSEAKCPPLSAIVRLSPPLSAKKLRRVLRRGAGAAHRPLPPPANVGFGTWIFSGAGRWMLGIFAPRATGDLMKGILFTPFYGLLRLFTPFPPLILRDFTPFYGFFSGGGARGSKAGALK